MGFFATGFFAMAFFGAAFFATIFFDRAGALRFAAGFAFDFCFDFAFGDVPRFALFLAAMAQNASRRFRRNHANSCGLAQRLKE